LWPNNRELEDEKQAMPLNQDVFSAPAQFNWVILFNQFKFSPTVAIE
jgi:hypothetical protein